MRTIVFCLEEPSAREMLEGVLPKILPENCFPRFLVFEGKQDLDKRLEKKVRGWNQPDSAFIVMRDKDRGDCYQIKRFLASVMQRARRPDALIRIACHELESFYLGDLAAVEQGLSISGLARQQEKGKFRNPDNTANAAEELEKITGQKYQKIAGSRAIAPFLALDGTNRSNSFNILISGIQKIVGMEAD